jgi:hypothetical protein
LIFAREKLQRRAYGAFGRLVDHMTHLSSFVVVGKNGQGIYI